MIIRIIVMVLFLDASVLSAVNIDSLECNYHLFETKEKVLALRLLSNHYKFSDSEKAINYLEESMKLARSNDIKPEIAEAYYGFGVLNAIYHNYDEAYENFEIALRYYDSLDNDYGKCNCYMSFGKLNNVGRKYGEALEAFYKSLDCCIRNDNKILMTESYHYLGKTYTSLFDLPKAIDCLAKALKISHELKDSLLIYGVNLSLADAFYNLEAYDSSLYYYGEGLDYYLKKSDYFLASVVLNNMANIYREQDKFAKALEFYDESMTILPTHNINDSILYFYNTGEIFIDLKKYDLSEKHLNLSLQLAEKVGDIIAISDAYKSLGGLFLTKGEFSKAEGNFLEALKFAQNIDNPNQTLDIVQGLSDLYSRMNKHDKALKYFKRFHTLKDSLNKNENDNVIKSITSKVDAEWKLNKIEKDKKIQQLVIESQNYLIYFLITIAIMAVILTIFLYWRYRLRKKTNETLASKNMELSDINQQLKVLNDKLLVSESKLRESNATKDKFFSIIAHDLKNPAGSFVSLSTVLCDDYDSYSPEEIKDYMHTLNKAAKSLYSLIENLLKWSRIQSGKITVNKECSDLYMIMKNNIDLLSETANLKNIKLVSNIAEKNYVYADPNMVDTIFRNLISNAIKFTNNGGIIKVSAEDEGNCYRISVEDNGVGMREENIRKLFRIDTTFSKKGTAGETGTGLGLILVREFLIKNSGDIRVESNLGEGTTFIFDLPKYQN